MDLALVGVNYLALLFALCFHEFAHGWVAKQRGDRTAEFMGRLTMNPAAHADVIGTVVLPLMAMIFKWPFMLGWAKPVPVNERNLKNPRLDMFWIASAGPLSNVLLGTLAIFAYVFWAPRGMGDFAQAFLKSFIGINFILAVFNMIPIHPLDGAKVLARFLPESINNKLEEHQQIAGMVLLGLMFTGALRFIVGGPTVWAISFVEGLARGILP